MTIADQHRAGALLESFLALNDAAPADAASAPTAETIALTIDAVFHASLLREEGRYALTRVVLGDFSQYGWRFPKPMDIAPQTLKTLSPFMDAPGVSYSADPRGRIVGLQVGEPSGLSVFSTRPGRLVVAAGLRVIAIYEEGEWHTFDARDYDWLWTFAYDAYGTDVAPMAMRLIRSTRRHGRGALFVIADDALPADCITPPQLAVAECAVTETTCECTVEKAIEDGNAYGAMHALHVAENAKLRRKRHTAMLCVGSGIDGATTLDFKLRPTGFGSKIVAKPTSDEVLVYDWARKQTTPKSLSDIGGTRHQSAARLVQNCLNAAAIVISQDGPTSLLIHSQRANEPRPQCLILPRIDRILEAEWCYREPE